MRIVIIQPYYQGEEYTEDRTDFENCETIEWEFQPHNNGSYWLFLTFKEGTKEYALFQGGCTAIDFNPKTDEFHIHRD